MAKFLLLLISIVSTNMSLNAYADTINGNSEDLSQLHTIISSSQAKCSGPKIAWGFNNFGFGGYRPYYGSYMGGYPMNYGYNNMMYNNLGNRYMYPMNGYGFGSMYNNGLNPYGGVSYSYRGW